MTLSKPPTRALPVLAIAPPVVGAAGPRDPLVPRDERLAEFRPESRALPAFFVWTLGAKMNYQNVRRTT
jgi:hypothetical protein